MSLKIKRSRSYRVAGYRGVADRRNHVSVSKIIRKRKGM